MSRTTRDYPASMKKTLSPVEIDHLTNRVQNGTKYMHETTRMENRLGRDGGFSTEVGLPSKCGPDGYNPWDGIVVSQFEIDKPIRPL